MTARTTSIWTLVALIIATPAIAGKNRHSALIVHTNDAVSYTADAAYCGPDFDDPGDCEAAGTRTDKPIDEAAVLWLLAAFPPNSTPGVTVIYFGIEHSLAWDSFVDWRFCAPGGSIEIPDDGWPVDGLGNSVAFGSPIVDDRLFPFYWLALLGEPGDYFRTDINPFGGYACFVDDSNPPEVDLITRFGLVRWSAEGFKECPGPVTLGACCLADTTCRIADREECDAAHGEYMGDGTDCEPNPCPPPDPFGSCCFPDGHCEMFTFRECTIYGGTEWDQGGYCEYMDCPEPPQACCFLNGDCRMLMVAACLEDAGVPQGRWSSCDQASCRPLAWGACCLSDGVCEVRLQEDCESDDGAWYEGVSCEGLSCLTPVLSVTWGKVRISFR